MNKLHRHKLYLIDYDRVKADQVPTDSDGMPDTLRMDIERGFLIPAITQETYDSNRWNVITEVNTATGKQRYRVDADFASHRAFRSERRAKRAALRLNRRESWQPL